MVHTSCLTSVLTSKGTSHKIEKPSGIEILGKSMAILKCFSIKNYIKWVVYAEY